MKLIVPAVLALFVFAITAGSAPAAEDVKSADDVVVAAADKPDRSPKNPNDNTGKDDNPDDGDAGKGNDDKDFNDKNPVKGK